MKDFFSYPISTSPPHIYLTNIAINNNTNAPSELSTPIAPAPAVAIVLELAVTPTAVADGTVAERTEAVAVRGSTTADVDKDAEPVVLEMRVAIGPPPPVVEGDVVDIDIGISDPVIEFIDHSDPVIELHVPEFHVPELHVPVPVHVLVGLNGPTPVPGHTV